MALPDFAADSVFARACRSPHLDASRPPSTAASSASPAPSETVSRVLVVHCGGTIGMEHIPGRGYAPSPGFLLRHLRASSTFHDPTYRIVMDDEGPSYGGDDSPLLGEPASECSSRHGAAGHAASACNGAAHDDAAVFSAPSDWLAMPVSIFGRRVLYRVTESAPLMDSSNATHHTWTAIAGVIEEHYRAYDAFVVLHGTDTMAYSASAVAFLLEDLGKSVIFTGAQIPFAEVRNDAAANMLGALTLAGHYVIPEVTLFFANRLLRGCRCVKADAASFEAFASPNCKWIARLGVNVDIRWERVWRGPVSLEPRPFRAHRRMEHHVGVLRLFPGISAEAVRAALAAPMRGVVVESFGAGNAPDNRPDVRALLEEAAGRGVVMVNVSQCGRGAVTPLYSTALSGVVPGADMTTEAALTKLAFLLGQDELRDAPAEIARLMATALRGELTAPVSRVAALATPPSMFQLAHHAHGSTLGRAYAGALASATDAARPALASVLRPAFFHAAASAGDTASLADLHDAFSPAVPLDCPDVDQTTTLQAAARAGRADAVRWLLVHGANVHLRDRWGRTALIDAIDEWRVHRQARGAAVSVTGLDDGRDDASPGAGDAAASDAAVGDAVVCDEGPAQPWRDVIELLAQAGATLPGSSRRLRSLLMRAARQGDTGLLAVLHRHGLDVAGARNEDGRSVLHVAALHRRASVAAWLRGAGLYAPLAAARDLCGLLPADLGSV